jgi:hypothetical protein
MLPASIRLWIAGSISWVMKRNSRSKEVDGW